MVWIAPLNATGNMDAINKYQLDFTAGFQPLEP